MIKIERPKEFQCLEGSTIQDVYILDQDDPNRAEDPFCAQEEILLECHSEKEGHLEVRIYVDGKGNLCVYTD